MLLRLSGARCGHMVERIVDHVERRDEFQEWRTPASLNSRSRCAPDGVDGRAETEDQRRQDKQRLRESRA